MMRVRIRKKVIMENMLKQFSDEQIETLKAWGDLQGGIKRLGGGSEGEAFKVGDKVLKITTSDTEAQSAAALIPLDHPNIYDISKVGHIGPNRYAIIYDYLDEPSAEIGEVTKYVWDLVDRRRTGSPTNAPYRWTEQSMDQVKQVIDTLIANQDKLIQPNLKKSAWNMPEKFRDLLRNAGITDKYVLEVFPLIARVIENDMSIDLTKLTGKTKSQYSDKYSHGIVDYLKALKGDPRLEILNDLFLALTFMEKRGIHFVDLSGGNIKEKDGKVVIIDLGYTTKTPDVKIEKVSL